MDKSDIRDFLRRWHRDAALRAATPGLTSSMSMPGIG